MKWIPRILSILCLWGAVATMIIYVEPELVKDVVIPGAYLPFYLLLTIALWYSVRSLVITLTIVAGLILSSAQLMHWGLAVVLILTLVIESWYIYRRHEKIYPTNEPKNRDTGVPDPVSSPWGRQKRR